MIPVLLYVKTVRTVHTEPYWILYVQFLQLKAKLHWKMGREKDSKKIVNESRAVGIINQVLNSNLV